MLSGPARDFQGFQNKGKYDRIEYLDGGIQETEVKKWRKKS